MNDETLFYAFASIDDDLIEKSEKYSLVSAKKYQNRQYHNWPLKNVTRKRFVSLAALFTIIVSMVFFVSVTQQYKNPTRNINMITLNGMMYEIISNEEYTGSNWGINNEILTKHGLSYPINESDIGIQIGRFSADDGIKYNVFDYNQFNGQNVLLVQKGSDWQFALFCNLSNNNTININDLLELYGYNDYLSITEVGVGGINLSNVDFDFFYNELNNSTILDSYVDTDNTEHVIITIKGGESDVLTLNYYPKKKLIECALTFYQISDDLASVLNQ